MFMKIRQLCSVVAFCAFVTFLLGAISSQASTLGNISSRAVVGEGDDIIIGGLIISGSADKTVVIRGIGPSMTALGVEGALANPMLRLFDSSGTMIDNNNNWETHDNASLIPEDLQPTNPLEPAIYTTLAPGAYTAHVLGVGADPTGIGLVEIFEVEDAKERNPAVITSDWPMSTPEEQSMDSATLNGVMDFIEQASLDVESLIVIRHGYIVLEEYPDPEYDRDSMHIANSVTKSFVSALIGIAIQQGHIAGVDQKMVDLFPDRNVGNLDGGKQDITLEDILTMTAGMEWAEWAEPYVDCSNDYINALWCQGDPVQHILDLPMSEQPGTRWNYNGGTSHLLSALVAGFSGTNDTLDFAREFLFSPMGITVSDWEFDGTGMIRQGGGGLWLRPRDMAKFGYLYLHNGNWEGEQIVPAAFVSESVSTQSYFDQSSGYGYQSWWTLPATGVYYAAGLNGQKIYVVPDLDLVVVFTAYLPDGTDHVQTPMLFDYIMAACDP